MSTGVLQSSMYSLKPLKRTNTNARLSIKIEVKKVGLEMTLEFRDVCNMLNVCWFSDWEILYVQLTWFHLLTAKL